MTCRSRFFVAGAAQVDEDVPCALASRALLQGPRSGYDDRDCAKKEFLVPAPQARTTNIRSAVVETRLH